MTIVSKVLNEAKMQPAEVDDVVMIGASSRIPRIQTLLGKLFHGRELHKTINPVKAVARGAVIYAASLEPSLINASPPTLLLDVTPLSLGIEVYGGRFRKSIERNTPIPAQKRSDSFRTAIDGQASVEMQVCEGERKMATEKHLFGEFDLDGMTLARAGAASIEVTFAVDDDFMLTVSACEPRSGTDNKQAITTIKGRA